jgi:hypothetical protein
VQKLVCAGVLLALALIAAGPAQAAPLAPVGRHFADSVLFAGDQLVVGTDSKLEAVTPRGTFRKLFETRRKGAIVPEIEEVAGARGRLAFVLALKDFDNDGEFVGFRLRTGPLNGPFRAVSATGARAVAFAEGGLADIEGATTLQAVWRADDGSRTVLVNDPYPYGLAADGRHVAVASRDGRVQVFEVAPVRPLYGFAFPAWDAFLIAPGGGLAILDRNHAVSRVDPGGDPVSVALPTEPRALLAAGEREIRYETYVGHDLVQGRVHDLVTGDDHAFTPFLPYTTNGISLLAFTDSALAWQDQTTGCLYAGDMPQEAPRWPVGRGCRPRMFSDIGDVVDHGQVLADLACPGGPGDTCAGSLRLVLTRRHVHPRVLSRWPFMLAAGESVKHAIRIPRRPRAGLRVQVRMAPGSTASGNDSVDIFR